MPEIIKPKMMNYHRQILVCVGERCSKKGEGQALYDSLKEKFSKAGLNKGDLRVKKTRATCFGTCKSGALICIQPDGIWYYDVTDEKLDRIIEEHLLADKPIMEWVYHDAKTV